MQDEFKVLFDKHQCPIDASRIRRLVANFSESYDKVVKKVIDSSANLDRKTFDLNTATLLPSFGMTRRGAFRGLRIVKDVIKDPNRALDACWTQAGKELLDLRSLLRQQVIHERSRTILELLPEKRNAIVLRISELFDTLEWTTVNGSDIGRVGASKILFAVLPEIALPIDNAEWDNVFRTHSYGRVLNKMIDEIDKWEKETGMHLETLDLCIPTTLTSVYNVMAMDARPPRKHHRG